MKAKLKRILTGSIVGVVAAMGTPQAGLAEDKSKPPPDPKLGRQLAERLCKNCHVVNANVGQSVPAGVPTFAAIANRIDQTAAHITARLIEPHAPMPDLQLTRAEIKNIIAYLDTLRDANAGKPLLDPAKGDRKKPDYPSPS